MRWLPLSPTLSQALEDARDALDRVELLVGDTEPAPVSIVLLQSKDGGKVHRAARVEGIPGLLTYEGDNMDVAQYRVIPDLSKLSDESDLCRRCFGVLDDVLEQDR